METSDPHMADLPDDIFQYTRVLQDVRKVIDSLHRLKQQRLARETIHTQAAVWQHIIALAYREMLQEEKAQEAVELRNRYIEEARSRGVPALREFHTKPARDGKKPKNRTNSDTEKPFGVGVMRGDSRLPASA